MILTDRSSPFGVSQRVARLCFRKRNESLFHKTTKEAEEEGFRTTTTTIKQNVYSHHSQLIHCFILKNATTRLDPQDGFLPCLCFASRRSPEFVPGNIADGQALSLVRREWTALEFASQTGSPERIRGRQGRDRSVDFGTAISYGTGLCPAGSKQIQ